METTARLALEKVSSQDESSGPRRRFGGLLVRRECWTLCWPAKLLLMAVVLGALFCGRQFFYSFLAVTNPVPAKYLVVEGWLPPYALKETVALFKAGHYQKIFTAGCLDLDDWDLPANKTYAELAAERLNKLGISNDLIQAVPSRVSQKDRTYYSALAVREWCEQNHVLLGSFDLVSVGPHARRSWLLYEKAFHNDVKIGVIAIENKTYDTAHWWRSSQGVREVVGETIAYFYARVLFHPDSPGKTGS
jgi:hypothetical protein